MLLNFLPPPGQKHFWPPCSDAQNLFNPPTQSSKTFMTPYFFPAPHQGISEHSLKGLYIYYLFWFIVWQKLLLLIIFIH
jgi:hypothetical protein